MAEHDESGADSAGNDDIKARMKAALERKQAHDQGVEHHDHRKEKGHETHGPLGGQHLFRRKSGGGGA